MAQTNSTPQPATLSAGQADSLVGTTLIVAAALFVLTRIFLLYFFTPLRSDLPTVYFDDASKVIDLQESPYQGDVQIEYPPLAWWVIAAPRLVSGYRITDVHDVDQIAHAAHMYSSVARSEMLAFDIGSFMLLLLLVSKRRPAWLGWAALSYVITTTILAHLLYDRLDIGLSFLLMAWAYCWVRSFEKSPRTIVWSTAAYAFLGLSISFKLIPVVGVPLLLIADWRDPLRWRRLAPGIAALTLFAVGPFVVQWLISGAGVFWMFSFHANRGIQAETIYASAIKFASLFGVQAKIENKNFCFEILGTLSVPMKTVALVLQLVFFLGLGLNALLSWKRFNRQTAYQSVCLAIIGAVILANVFSPQYLIWAIGLVILLAVDALPDRMADRWIMLGSLILVVAATTWVFPYHYFIDNYSTTYAKDGSPTFVYQGVYDPSPITWLTLTVRNVSYLAMVVWLGVAMFKQQRSNAVAPGRIS